MSPELAVIDQSYAQAKDYAPLACLVMLLLFARSGLYRDRPQRPGFATVISSLFQVTVVILLYAVIEGDEFSSYYIFYGTLLFALLYICSARWLFERASGAILRAAGYRRRAVLVGSGANIEAVAHALSDNSQVEPFGYVSLDDAPQRRPARLRLAGAAGAPLRRDRRGADRRLGLRAGEGRGPGGPLPPAAASACGWRRPRWRS